ncbi:hypothetical protein TI03_06745 [Achromatium sp. WMS1]|nr:hypothetical protein TI03_06745 [Achromatium sp. WMS1]
MMDDFMRYMGIEEGWTIPFNGNIAGKWMRQDATLMLNHSISKNAHQCTACHNDKEHGIMPFERLGYPPARVKDLRNLREMALLLTTEVSAPQQPTGAMPQPTHVPEPEPAVTTPSSVTEPAVTPTTAH